MAHPAFRSGLYRPAPVIVGCHTAIFYPAPTSLQATVHNVLYNGPAYTSLFGKATGFHVLNRDEEQRYRQAFPGKPVRRSETHSTQPSYLTLGGQTLPCVNGAVPNASRG